MSFITTTEDAIMIINVTQESLEAVIEAGLAVLSDKTNLPASRIPELAAFILNYYSPDVSAFLSVQFIGEPDVK